METKITPTLAEFVAEVTKRSHALNRTPMAVTVVAGYSPNTWYNWEAGRTSPTAEAMDVVRSTLSDLERRSKN